MDTKILLGTLLAFSPLLFTAKAGAQEQEPSNLPDEYLKNLKNYEFVNTTGMGPQNRPPYKISWIPEGRQDKDDWEFPTPEEQQRLKELGITFPEFNFLEGGDIAPGQKRQRTHTVEHIIYAMPGDAVSLYPYYGLEEYTELDNPDNFMSTIDYFETFSHWYDYKNGGRVIHTSKDGKKYDLLDFPYDRSYIQISDKYGFYGGVYMSPGTQGGKTYEVNSVEQYVEAVKAINDNGGRGTLRLIADIDFKDKNDIPMLGTDVTPFLGVFDGNGKTIKNLKIERNEHHVGIIKCAGNGAAVYNLILDNCVLSGWTQVGIVGYLTEGGLTATNIKVSDNCLIQGRGTESEHFVGAILGRCENNTTDNHLTIEDVYVGGKVGNPDMGYKFNTALCGWLSNEKSTTSSSFKNIVVNCTLTGPEDLVGCKYVRHPLGNEVSASDDGSVTETNGTWKFIFSECYGNYNSSTKEDEGIDKRWKSFTELPLLSGWTDSKTPSIKEISGENLGGILHANQNHRPWNYDNPEIRNLNDENQKRRKAGTSAVFYFPESLKDEWDRNEEYVIAADFSQTFEPQTHINIEEMTLTEPLVAFRHIFRIRDAHALTESFQNDNQNYIRRNQHKVTARVGANFQIRLDSPLPTDNGVTNYYIQNGDNFDRITDWEIKVLKGDDRTETSNPGFYLDIDIRMRRSKADPNGLHATEDKQYRYHTMLRKDNVNKEDHYIVQIIAKGTNLVLMEYDVRFLPETAASLITEARLYDEEGVTEEKDKNKFRHARDEYMKEKYGEPADHIDFDNYFKLNQLPEDDALRKKMISYSVPVYRLDFSQNPWYNKDNMPVWDHYSENHKSSSKMHHSFYKWPISWERSTYGFGYNYRYNYNMYMLATHSTNVPYHGAVDEWNVENAGDALYDRLYYKTKRLRESNPEIKQEQGYFYYVNAASDPGVSARLNFDLPCPGSRVIVSAWVAEMTARSEKYESANLSFNIVAVTNSGERITLHNFITGYLGDGGNGKWYNVYYSFVPRLAEFNLSPGDVQKYELELAHNGKSSVGADYAIDDIRAYVVPPVGEANHFGYACDETALDLRVETSFETLLEKSGAYEAFGEKNMGETLTLYYAFVDKEKYDANPKGEFEKYVVKVNTGDKAYSSLTFTSNYNYEEFREYKYDKDTFKTDADSHDEHNTFDKAYRMTLNGDRLIVFDTQAVAGKLRVGKEYYIVFKSAPQGEVPEDLATFFDLNGDCSYNCVMVVKPSLKIKFDGEVQEEFSNLSVCENQWPVIQVNVMRTDTKEEVDKNAYFDWFDGSMNEFENYRFENYPTDRTVTMTDPDNGDADCKEHYLKYALEVFRKHYWEAENVADVKYMTDMAEEDNSEEVPELEQWMSDIIDTACQPDATGRKRLLLHNTAFVLPPKDLPADKAKDKIRVVAIPIVELYDAEDNITRPSGDYKVCPSPTEIGVTIAHRTPILKHGLTDAKVSYPANLNDVPLRVGLNQIKPGAGFILRRINMPLRESISSDGAEKQFKLVNEPVFNGNNIETIKEGAIVLAQTNDPEYKELGSIIVKDGKEVDSGNLLWVGEIREFNAKAREADAPVAFDNFVAQIYDNLNMKEGYFYRFRFRFEEKHEAGIDADDEVVCQGQDVFTIKVVPEYMQWTGDMNLSWDNDDNWRRVTAAEILKTDASADNTLFTEGANSNRRSYAPLPFTKTIIDAPTENEDEEIESETPWLYAPKPAVEVQDCYSDNKNYWTPDPNGSLSDHEKAEMKGNTVGAPTSLIQYDMTAYVNGEKNETEVRCRPWTANKCSEIHFLPGATIMGQQYLNYDRAWVDIELDHSRWYLLSTPLKDVYAGDFYLPTANGCQTTELFKEISFDSTLHNRFAPAVYQRGWDKGEAKVYEIGQEGPRNAAVKTFWSHVYNDMNEAYGEGNAFSIKTDISNVEKPGDKVLFRLPKADKEYFYYSSDGTPGSHKATLSKDNSYKLNDVDGTLSVSTATAGKYFMVGNPFMTHLDIASFLNRNSSKLNQKYWVITEDGMIAGSVSESGVFLATPTNTDESPEDPSVIAPMQGFFVEAVAASKSLSLDYKRYMMRRYDSDDKVLIQTTRSPEALPSLKIISMNGGKASSAAIVIAGDEDRAEAVDAFDFRDFGILSTAFIARNGKARSIDFSKNLEGLEIGVIADQDTETTLLFKGTENFDTLFLIDLNDNSVTPLQEISSLKVKGTVSGRLFITSGSMETVERDALQWRVDDNALSISDLSSSGELDATVYDLLGRVVDSASTSSSELSFILDKGVFVVRISNGCQEKSIKVRI